MTVEGQCYKKSRDKMKDVCRNYAVVNMKIERVKLLQ